MLQPSAPGTRVTSRKRISPKGRASSIQPASALRYAAAKAATSPASCGPMPAKTYVAPLPLRAASVTGASQTDMQSTRRTGTSGQAAPTEAATASPPAQPAHTMNSSVIPC